MRAVVSFTSIPYSCARKRSSLSRSSSRLWPPSPVGASVSLPLSCLAFVGRTVVGADLSRPGKEASSYTTPTNTLPVRILKSTSDSSSTSSLPLARASNLRRRRNLHTSVSSSAISTPYRLLLIIALRICRGDPCGRLSVSSTSRAASRNAPEPQQRSSTVTCSILLLMTCSSSGSLQRSITSCANCHRSRLKVMQSLTNVTRPEANLDLISA